MPTVHGLASPCVSHDTVQADTCIGCAPNGFHAAALAQASHNARYCQYRKCLRSLGQTRIVSLMNLEQQASDQTLWRFPHLWSPNCTIHLRKLEEALAETVEKLKATERAAAVMRDLVEKLESIRINDGE